MRRDGFNQTVFMILLNSQAVAFVSLRHSCYFWFKDDFKVEHYKKSSNTSYTAQKPLYILSFLMSREMTNKSSQLETRKVFCLVFKKKDVNCKCLCRHLHNDDLWFSWPCFTSVSIDKRTWNGIKCSHINCPHIKHMEKQ